METKLLKWLVVLLLALQAALTGQLWLVNPQAVSSTTTFAILLGANLLAFAAMAHLYRTSKGPPRA
jgi:hypothetical protein